MSQTLRDYQARGCRQTREHWDTGHRSVCFVSPTGSGKTTCGTEFVGGFRRSVWVAHRKELIAQAVERLELAGHRVGAVCPGMRDDAAAPVQVGTIQSFLARGLRPDADLMVFDEGHHHVPASEYWHTFAGAYQHAKQVFLTATPERRDGSPMGDVCSEMVVAASYSELLAAGHLAPCVVYAPPRDKASSGWACDPVQAYQQFAPGTMAFAFFDRVARSTEWERAFCLAGVNARTIDGKTKDKDRDRYLEDFAAGLVRVLCNVATMTEGVDIPAAATCLLARCPDHASTFLQMVGRVLRPHPSKPHALLLDLVDATARHGYPTEDREYSLTGKAIQRASKSEVRRCAECMAMYPNGLAACPLCGWVPPKPRPVEVRIYDAGLQRVYQGADTADEHKLSEYRRLRMLAKRQGYGLQFVVKEYKKLFGVEPSLRGVPEQDKRAEYDALRAVQIAKGLKPGFVGVRYKALFGAWPPREWALAPLQQR
jgi:superfamily II DNA or RNA helicase